MKNSLKTKIRVALTSFFVLFLFSTAYAAQDYAVLESLPGVGATTNITSYVPAIFKLSIGVAAAMAFAVLTFGGIMYATSDAISGKDDGKRYIENAIWGLLLVIGAYAILYTINPQILSLKLSLPTQNIQPGEQMVTPGIPLDPSQVTDDASIRTYLATNGVTVNSDPCVPGKTTGCTNVNDLPSSMQTTLINLKANCNCAVVITGGTEGGHKTHGPGIAIVDLRPNVALNSYINSGVNNLGGSTPANNTHITKNFNQHSVTFVFETAGGGTGGTSSGEHWHTILN